MLAEHGDLVALSGAHYALALERSYSGDDAAALEHCGLGVQAARLVHEERLARRTGRPVDRRLGRRAGVGRGCRPGGMGAGEPLRLGAGGQRRRDQPGLGPDVDGTS